MDLGQEDHFTNYRRVLNRATWCPLIASRILLGLIVLALISRDRPIVLAGDDTIEIQPASDLMKFHIYLFIICMSPSRHFACDSLAFRRGRP